MSRVGLSKLAIPSSVKLEVQDDQVKVTASGKTQTFPVPEGFIVKQEGGKVGVEPINKVNCNRAMWGTVTRNLFQVIQGLDKPFEKKVELKGVGYKAALQGKKLVLDLGYSHKVEYDLHEDVSVKIEKPTELLFSSVSKQKLGQTVSEIMKHRKPEPYKGKGIIPAGYFVLRKEGKKK
ncbi:MAG: 50S ribosomal protein L6 [Alphaproteobacteria bacterium]|nr:MAG: 50S ribosomal protein L6 [Alphaproteobacteria bacterium]